MAVAHNNLGGVLRRMGRLDEAVAAYRRAIAIKPDYADAFHNLGSTLHDLKRFPGAIAAIERAVQLKPDHAEAFDTLGNSLKDLRRYEEAIAAYRRSLDLKADSAPVHNNLGTALWDAGRLDEAADMLERALALQPDLAAACNNLGNVRRNQGRLDEALACFRRAVELQPELVKAASNLVYALHFHPDYDAPAILAEHRRWARLYAEPLAAEIRPHENDRTVHRKLKVGFVSPDFREHPVGRLLLPLLAHLDRREVEVWCYSDVPVPDGVTERLKALADRWQETAGLDDRRVADRVRGDRIDILIDLALHTAGNRMLVFARKPAPVQATMLGLPSTTGLGTIDYRLTDPYLDPPGAVDADYSERSIRLPHSFWCYQPPEHTPPVTGLPALSRGIVTFGCLNQFTKVSRAALLVWIEVLRSLPGSRLLIHAQPGSHRDAVRTLLQDAGIAADRIEFAGKAPLLAYFQTYQGLDLCLDPFPHNGGTTTMDSLWMGVPVITLSGRTAVGRGGASLLSNLGLEELIARTPRDYVAIALRWARDPVGLAALRSGLRPRVQASPLMDGRSYAAAVEAALRGMWEDWCGP
jgi:predicted O-linked N-acetylglucosamine transferase (SPINDLY family)